MAITDEDYLEMKRRLQADNVKLQFGRGSKEQALGYSPQLGEPIVTNDSLEFAIGDGTGDSSELIFRPLSFAEPNFEGDKQKILNYFLKMFLQTVPPGFQTPTTMMHLSIAEGALTAEEIISVMEGSNKFCIADGRELPENCFVRKNFGILKAPNAKGRFERHLDQFPHSSVNPDSVSLGWTQEDALQTHYHNYYSYEESQYRGRLWKNYDRDVFNFVVNGYDYMRQTWGFSNARSSSETRPKNIAILSFFRFDW